MFLDCTPSNQKPVIDQMLEVLNTHSEKSKKDFIEKLTYLNNYGGEKISILISGCTKTVSGMIEFHLGWFDFNQMLMHEHPYSIPWQKRPKPFMIGGLIYHPDSDNWGVHT
jgi:hypothetical protein